MSKLSIDLSGRGGLAPRFFGDINRTSASPELRYIGSENQFADGIYNPFRRFGYLSPANNTFESVTQYVPTTLTTTIGSSQTWQYTAVSIPPVSGSTTIPSVLGTPASGTVTGSVTSLTIPLTVASGSNRMLTVIATNPTGGAATSATFNGTAMTLVTTGSTGMYYSVFQLAAPTVTTADVVVTWSVSSSNVTAGCVVTQNTSQSISTVYATNTATSASASVSITPTSNYNLILGAVTSLAATHTQASTQTEIFNFLSTAGTTRFSESRRNAISYTTLGCTVYDDINDDHYWGERGSASSTIPGNILKGDGLDDRALESVVSITGAVITDLEIYQVNSVRKLFYVYKNGSTGAIDIGIANLPFASNNNTWLTTTASIDVGSFSNTTLTNPFLRKADNGFLYLFQDNVVHKIDGTSAGGANGSVETNVLMFPSFFQLTDAIDYKGKMIMTIIQRSTDLSVTENINFSSECGVYVWDRQSTQVSMNDYIPLSGVKEIRKIYVSPTGSLRIICVASDRVVQVREFSNSTFQIIEEFPPLSYPNFPDSLTVAHTVTYWLGNDGYIYGHGSPTNKEREGVFKLGQPSTTFSSGGAILYGGGNTYTTGVSGFRQDIEGFYLSYNDSINGVSLKKWLINAENSVNSNIQSTAQGDIYTLVKYLPKLSTVNFIRIFGAPSLLTGDTVVATIKVYFNQSTTAWASKPITRDQWSRGYIDIPVNKHYINAIQLEIEYNSAQTIGRSDFAPSYAEVDYTATETNL